MGMFDYVFINTDRLPVTDKEKEILGPDPGFQTKSLECVLANILITDNGWLLSDEGMMDWDIGRFNGVVTTKVLCTNASNMKRLFHYGYIEFYNGMTRFIAKFMDGELVKIEKELFKMY